MTLLIVFGSIFAVVIWGWTGLNWNVMLETGNYLPVITHIFVPADLSHLILEWILVAMFWHNGYSKRTYGRVQMTLVFFITCILSGIAAAFLYSASPALERNLICGCTAGIYGWVGFILPELIKGKQWKMLAKTGALLVFVGVIFFVNLPVHLIGLLSGCLLKILSAAPKRRDEQWNTTG